MISIKSKIKGALYGYAIGDAMGATTEFMDRNWIKEKYGEVNEIIGGGWLHLQPGKVTDDTEMTLCVCEAIARFPRNSHLMLNRCCENFTNWYLAGPIDVGNSCARSISKNRQTKDYIKWLEVTFDPESLGNGSLMRTMPIVLSGLGEDVALSQSRLTHNNDICDTFVKSYYNILTDVLAGNELALSPFLIEPTGHIYNTYTNSIYWFATSECFEDAIIGPVNDGGDADTIAAITGSLAGAYYGFEAIPQKWIAQLDPVIKIQLDEYANIFEKLYEKVCTK